MLRTIARSLVSTALVMCFTIAAAQGDEGDDLKAMQGSWVPVKGEFNGKPVEDPVLKSIVLKIEDDKYEVVISGEEQTDRGTFKLDAKAQPKALTLTSLKGPNEGKTIPAIYEIKDGVLRVCYDMSGAGHPKEFKTMPFTVLYLLTYERPKK
jgi:uncharacterized protein (TIGR03067 family)